MDKNNILSKLDIQRKQLLSLVEKQPDNEKVFKILKTMDKLIALISEMEKNKGDNMMQEEKITIIESNGERREITSNELMEGLSNPNFQLREESPNVFRKYPKLKG